MRYGWSLDPNDWLDLQKLLADSKWSRVYLDSEYKDRVPSNPGVYIISGNTNSIGNMGDAINCMRTAVYVGQSINLKGRFQDHIRGYGNVIKAKQTFRRLEYWWHEISRSELKKYEQALVSALGPSANEVNVIKAKIGVPVRI
jgi:hypothetical protein